MKTSEIRASRKICPRCRRAGDTCLCAFARTFSTEALFVILLHPKEARRTIGTARIVKICVEDTILIQGRGPELDENPKLQSLLADHDLDPWLLFPGSQSVAVESRPKSPGKRPAIFIVDGTWHQARKMIRTSRLLQGLPRMAFDPERESSYGFRKQPARHCLSTVEAVHEVIRRLERPRAPSSSDVLLQVFSQLVRTQLDFAAAPVEGLL